MQTSTSPELIGAGIADAIPAYIVDDNDDDRIAAARVAIDAGLRARQFRCGQDVLDALPRLQSGIFILDVMMPGIDGTAVLKAVMARSQQDVVIMMSAHVDVSTAVAAMRAGAQDFLLKPLHEADTQSTMSRAIHVARDAQQASEQKVLIDTVLRTITPKEMRVLRKLVAGKRNKMIAHELGVSERTVEVHRSRLISRVEAGTFAGLIAFAVRAGVEPDND